MTGGLAVVGTAIALKPQHSAGEPIDPKGYANDDADDEGDSPMIV